MKVLWFANTPCGAIEKLSPGLYIGGWMLSLQNEITQYDNIELSICFYHHEEIPPFLYKGVQYYPVKSQSSSSKIKKGINLLRYNSSDEKDIQALLAVINKCNPNVIHIHGTEENFGLIQESCQLPVVISLQGVLSPYLEKYFSGISYSAIFRYEGIIPKLLFQSMLRPYRRMIKNAKREQKILKFTKNIIGRTKWDKRVSSVIAPNARYFHIDELLRPSFYNKEWNKQQQSLPIKIVTTMSGGVYKGLETIVKTTQLLKEKTSFEYNWFIIGQGETSPLTKMVKRWMKVDYSKLGIHFIGELNETDLISTLQGADIYCQVSHIENSPNSLCEAMILGMPIIASYAGGTNSLLEDEVEGILVQEGESYSLAGAIFELTQDGQKAKNLGNKASVRAYKRHSKIKVTEDLITLYKKLQIKD